MVDQMLCARIGASCTWVLLALACTSPRESSPSRQAIGADALEGTEWIVSSLQGHPPVDGSNITMGFERGTVSGYSGCNWYGSSYSVVDTTVQFGAAESTGRACAIPSGLMDQEAKYHETLRQVTAIHIVANRLAMVDRAGATVLLLIPRVRAAMNPLDLVGTRWRLRSVDGVIQKDTSVTLMLLTEGEISGFAGCRAYTGTYQARGDEIRLPSIGMTATECDKGDAALLHEGRFTTDLSESSHYLLSADSLVIVTAPGRRLTFAASTAPLSPGQVLGDWEKQEQSLPPIHLRLWLERDSLRARLRLSGSESFGTATFDGRVLRLALSGRAEPLAGELVSANVLELRFGEGGLVYRLRR